MSCIECRYGLDACCRGDICCCCFKKLYNTAKRNKMNNYVKQSEKCEENNEDSQIVCEKQCKK